MKSIVITALAALFSAFSPAQINNSKTVVLRVYGNCDMCKDKIEEAGSQRGISKTTWDSKTGIAYLTFDSTKTTSTAILKKIALAGYDSDEFLAPDAVYHSLPACCKYVRSNKTAASIPANMSNGYKTSDNDHAMNRENSTAPAPKDTGLQALFNEYFLLKDALVKTDATTAAAKAGTFHASLQAVQMKALSGELHMVFMKVESSLAKDAAVISNSKTADAQRNAFMNLSANMILLMRLAKPAEPVYVQHCPMYNDGKGADWLSRESAIRNPYYGNMMLNCGKTVETITQ